jgi:NDP-sugar pyrophosphorylase family protein
MVPVAGKPVLEHLVRVCVSAGIHDIVISLNTNQRVIEEYFGDGNRFGARISYAYETTANDEDKLGAIGAIQYALEKTGGPAECIILGGDNVFYGLDVKAMREAHKKRGAVASIALFSLSDPRDAPQYGIAKVDASGRLTRFKEKPAPEEVFSDKVATAAYYLEESFVREYLPAYVERLKAQGQKADKLGDLWAHFVKELPLYGHAFQGMWGDTNNAKTYIETHKQAMNFVAPTSLEGIECTIYRPGNVCISRAHISPDATIRGPAIIEEGCVVEAGTVVGSGTHLMKNARVGKGASVQGSVVFRDCEIGEGARIVDSVLDIGVRVGRGAQVGPNCILGYKSFVCPNAKVLGETRVWPYCEIGAVVSGDVTIPEELFRHKMTDRLY